MQIIDRRFSDSQRVFFEFICHIAERAVHHIQNEGRQAEDGDQQRGEEKHLPDPGFAITPGDELFQINLFGV